MKNLSKFLQRKYNVSEVVAGEAIKYAMAKVFNPEKKKKKKIDSEKEKKKEKKIKKAEGFDNVIIYSIAFCKRNKKKNIKIE